MQNTTVVPWPLSLRLRVTSQASPALGLSEPPLPPPPAGPAARAAWAATAVVAHCAGATAAAWGPGLLVQVGRAQYHDQCLAGHGGHRDSG
jgi:hypothetical protein